MFQNLITKFAFACMACMTILAYVATFPSHGAFPISLWFYVLNWVSKICFPSKYSFFFFFLHRWKFSLNKSLCIFLLASTFYYFTWFFQIISWFCQLLIIMNKFYDSKNNGISSKFLWSFHMIIRKKEFIKLIFGNKLGLGRGLISMISHLMIIQVKLCLTLLDFDLFCDTCKIIFYDTLTCFLWSTLFAA